VLGVLLAVYDGAEVALKPVFGALADRAGPRPVLLGGLAAFAVFSAAFAVAGAPALAEPDREGVLARFVSGLSGTDEDLLRRVLDDAPGRG
jgi:MFS family permease